MELKDIDYEILSYIQHYDEITLEKINEKFSKRKVTIETRLSDLSQTQSFNTSSPYYGSGYIEQHYTTSKNLAGQIVIHPIHIYSITPLGSVTLENYIASNAKLKRRDFVLFIIPIIISSLALLKSYEDEIIWIVQQVLRLLK